MIVLPALLTLQSGWLPTLTAARAATPPVIDGRLVETEWQNAPSTDSFTQKRPFEGQKPTERTTVRVLYDDDAVYVGIACAQESAPVVARLARRDRQVESDSVTVGLDTRMDGKTAFEFTVNAAGVLSDGVYANDTDFSSDWDGLWDARTAITPGGWSAELRIPLQALRYESDRVQRWGLQVRRYLSARRELDEWAFAPATRAGEVSHYGRLEGMSRLHHRESLDFFPFAIARLRRDATSGSVVPDVSAGFDLRWRVTPQLTWNVTLNPDFGHIEADPAVLNLDSFETLRTEKRLFFVEGADIFNTPLNLFYTRRIGGIPAEPALIDEAPHHEELAQTPAPATILGAAKLVGKIGRHLSLGQLVAITDQETIAVRRADGSLAHRVAEPLTGFTVLRLASDLGAGWQVGGIAMSTHRAESTGSYPRAPSDGGSPGLQRCPGGEEVRAGQRCFHDAYVGGADATWRSPSGDYVASGQVGASVIHEGPPRTMPDGTIIASGDVSPAGRVLVAKKGGNWLWEVKYESRGRRVDYNDLGYMQRQNHQIGVATLRYRSLTPWWTTLNTNTEVSFFDHETLDFLNLQRGAFVESTWTLKNFWELFLNVTYSAPRFDDREVGDGTALQRGGFCSVSAAVSTDPRKPVRGELSSWVDVLEDGMSWNAEAAVTFLPLPQLEFSFSPTAFYTSGEQRYFATERGAHLFGELRAQSLGLTLRGAYTLTPRLSFEAYAQAFIVSEAYSNYTTFPAVRSGPPPRIRLRDLGPAPASVEANPDHESATLIANLVLRWEYSLGSTFFLVYTHDQNGGRTPPSGEPAMLRLPLLAPRAASDALLLKISHSWR
ncbi:DUF5916 domain-containing protein [Sorangium sp. So ce426]|uniref:DUF5916 domain-containing protein n=1 Tax=unclassified Sorangium TaxID=2621164 RepID=UPI003F5C14DA